MIPRIDSPVDSEPVLVDGINNRHITREWQRFSTCFPVLSWRLKMHFLLDEIKRVIINEFTGYHAPFSERRMILMLGDILMVVLAVYGASLLSEPVLRHSIHVLLIHNHWQWFPIALIGWWILAFFQDLYDIPSSYDYQTMVIRVLTLGLLSIIIEFSFVILSSSHLSHPLFFYLLALALPAILLWRLAYIYFGHRIATPHRILILGLGNSGQSIGTLLRQNAIRLNYQVIGYVDYAERVLSIPASFEWPILGQVTDLPKLVQEQQIHEVIVAIKHNLTEELFQYLMICQAQGVRISWMPNLHEKLCHSIPVEDIDPIWAMCALQGQPIFSRLQLIGKRVFDLVLVLWSLPFLGLLLPILAWAIRLDSPGPIFYRQVRSGRGGKPFLIYKFRTMVVDAERDGKPRWASKDDPRITRVGRFLRKTRLDELPQIINILKGEMSLVGPRPERPEFIEELQKVVPFYQVRLLVKPGLTGWAQIHFDYGNSVEDAHHKLEYDFYYVCYWSLWLDLYTLFKTVSVVLRFRGI